MAKTRMISTDFWTDTRVDQLDPTEKLIYIYCFTNDKSCWSGCTEIPIKKIGYETGFDRDMVVKVLERFKQEGKVVYVDGYLIVKNFLKHHLSGNKGDRGKNNQFKAVCAEINLLPKHILTEAVKIIPEYYDILKNMGGYEDIIRGYEGASEGVQPSPISSSSPLPSSSPSTSISSKEEQAEPEYGKKDINDLIEIIKEACSKNGLLYSGKGQTERHAAKWILSKKFLERISEFEMTLEQFVNNVVMVSTKLKYNTTQLTSAKLLYYHREDIVNKAKQQSMKTVEQAPVSFEAF